MSKTKSPRNIKIKSNIQPKDENEECSGEDYIDLRSFKIIIKQIENIEPAFTVSDIVVEVKHVDLVIGQTEKIALIDKDLCQIEYEVIVQYNIADWKYFDKLISSPIYFTIWQSAGSYNEEMYAIFSDTSEEVFPFDIKERERPMYEAILGVKLSDPSKVDALKSGDDDKKKGKSKASNKTSQKSVKKASSSDKKKSNEGSTIINKKKSKEKSTEKATKSSLNKTKNEKDVKKDEHLKEVVIVGSCNIDLLPFFLGETEIEEHLPIHQDNIHMDDNMLPFADLPRILVNICVDKPIIDKTKKSSNILNFTIESIYSIPEEFSENTDYKIATVFPHENHMLPFELGNGYYTEINTNFNKFKVWPDLANVNNFSNCSKYRLDPEVSNIKNKGNINIKSAIESSGANIQWNILRRTWMDEIGTDVFKRNLSRYRCWPLEIYLTPKDVKIQQTSSEPKEKKTSKQSVSSKSKSSGSSSKGSTKSKASVKNRKSEPLHLMSFVDISTLLYPGVIKSRVACEVKYFQLSEFVQESGVEESYFYVKKEPNHVLKVESKNKKEAGKAGSARNKTKSKEDSSKKSKEETKEKQEIAHEVVEVTIIPSQKLKNKKGETTFIIVEVELLKPLVMKKPLEDLTQDLQKMLPSRPEIPKSVMSLNLAIADYRDSIKTLAHEINEEYQNYTLANEKESTKPMPTNFVKHLQSTGIYQQYMTTLMKSIPTLLNERYHFEENPKNTLAYERFISQAYVYLVDEMNVQVNSIVSSTNDHNIVSPIATLDYLFCAKEAEELEASLLAERYYLQALSKSTRNPDLYFNYAVFLVGLKDYDKAFEYLKESLALKNDHKYSLLLFAILLFEKEEFHTAESIFTTLLQYHSKFMEGWTCLYLFYIKRSNSIGCDVCLEQIVKYTDCEENRKNDNIFNAELAWSTTLCPKHNPWFKTAMTLINLRALGFADLALGCENLKETGVYRYYQGVILYLLRDYEHALAHLLVAQKLHGADYEVNSLIGHCYFRLGNYEFAKESYEFITYSYNHPEDMHMIYMNLALLYEKDNNLEIARKYLLHVCKFSPTPYSWLSLGIIFYKENNILYSEACLNESNTLDNNLSEAWAYLVLVNLNIGCNWMAEQCYKQLNKHKMNNEELLSLVEREMEKIK